MTRSGRASRARTGAGPRRPRRRAGHSPSRGHPGGVAPRPDHHRRGRSDQGRRGLTSEVTARSCVRTGTLVEGPIMGPDLEFDGHAVTARPSPAPLTRANEHPGSHEAGLHPGLHLRAIFPPEPGASLTGNAPGGTLAPTISNRSSSHSRAMSKSMARFLRPTSPTRAAGRCIAGGC